MEAAHAPVATPAADNGLALAGDLNAAPQPALLKLSRITKHWSTMPQPVLQDAQLAIAGGESIHVGGRNGVGKTTLLRIAAGLITPDRGRVSLDGFDPERSRREFQERIAFLPAGDRGLYARLSVRAHLDLWARVNFIPRAERQSLIPTMLERYELVELAKRRVDRLSMGQRQRVRLAGLTLHDPKLILLDEPFNSLDAEAVELAGSTLRSVLERGGSVLCCSPSSDRADFDFDRGYVLRDGKLEEE